MNQMALYSKCVTIRDAQIEERRHILEEQQEEDRRLDLMMEAERIKALQAYEAREAAKKEEQRRGALVLQKQIDERAADRLRALELREQERAQILAEIERVKQQEAEQLAAKRAAGRKLLEEVARTNAQQIERKKDILQAELEEDARIAAYVRAREQKELELQQEAARIAKEKELETARLRAQQERASDIKAELDELRAQRAAEAREREARARERKEQERLRALNEDLAQAREKQKQVKTKLLADQARQQQEEFFRIIDAQIQQQEMEAAAQRAGHELRLRHKDEVLRQIAENEERRKLERREFLEEGERMRAAHAAELSRLAEIKARRVLLRFAWGCCCVLIRVSACLCCEHAKQGSFSQRSDTPSPALADHAPSCCLPFSNRSASCASCRRWASPASTAPSSCGPRSGREAGRGGESNRERPGPPAAARKPLVPGGAGRGMLPGTSWSCFNRCAGANVGGDEAAAGARRGAAALPGRTNNMYCHIKRCQSCSSSSSERTERGLYVVPHSSANELFRHAMRAALASLRRRPSMSLALSAAAGCRTSARLLLRSAARPTSPAAVVSPAPLRRFPATRPRLVAMAAAAAPAAPSAVRADYEKLAERLREISSLSGVSGLLGWDEQARGSLIETALSILC